MSDRLVTGRFEHGKFRHELPEKLADLLHDTEKLLRQRGSEAINAARILSARPTPLEDASPQAWKARKALERLANSLERTWQGCLDLHGSMTDALSHAEPDESHDDDEMRGCISCFRNAGHWEPTRAADRHYCEWCAQFRSSHKVDPPLAILNARHRGFRITTAMLKAHGIPV